MNTFVLSTQAWLESIAKKEIQKQWWEIIEVVDRLITFKWDFTIAARVNIWSRVWNRLYLRLWAEDNIENFDNLYSLVNNIEFEKLIPKDSPIIVNATSIRSELHHTPSIQSITKKSIINRLVRERKLINENIKEDDNKPRFEIQVLIINNNVRIILNISGEPLHKRGYRLETSEAPIKENVAAWLVLLSDWRFKENFYDIFCGSWTIAIETIMIAKNIAPGLKRDFNIVDLWFISSDEVRELKQEARDKQFEWEYKIIASDIDNKIIEIAKDNAYRAWVLDDICFEHKNFEEYLKSSDLSWTLVTNPPYWERLELDDAKDFYLKINKILTNNKNLKWGFISSYLEFDELAKKDFYKKRKLYNWWEMCYFWKKK